MRPLIAIAALLVACSHDDAPTGPPIVEAVGGLPPFDALPGIALGQRAGEIKALRSTLDTIGYVGYGDTVPGYAITYVIPGSYDDGEPPGDDRTLTGVEARAEFPEDSSLLEEFRGSVAQATARLGATTCFPFQNGNFHGYAAVWALPTGAELAIAMYPEQKLSKSSRPYRPALVLRVKEPDQVNRYTPMSGGCDML